MAQNRFDIAVGDGLDVDIQHPEGGQERDVVVQDGRLWVPGQHDTAKQAEAR